MYKTIEKKHTKRGRDDRVVQLSLQIDKNKNRGEGDRVLQFSIQKKNPTFGFRIRPL